jgi:hypothetical protein
MLYTNEPRALTFQNFCKEEPAEEEEESDDDVVELMNPRHETSFGAGPLFIGGLPSYGHPLSGLSIYIIDPHNRAAVYITFYLYPATLANIWKGPSF